MTCYAYDDLERWRSVYPVDIFEDQFRKLCAKWEEGLTILEIEPESVNDHEELEITRNMLRLMNANPPVGFEAANHYYFSKGQLAEKIVNCKYLIEQYQSK